MIPAAVLLPLPWVAPLALVTRLSVTYLHIGLRPSLKLLFSVCVASAGRRHGGNRGAAGPAAAAHRQRLAGGARRRRRPRRGGAGPLRGRPARRRRRVAQRAGAELKDARGTPAVDDVDVALVCLGALLTPLLAQSLAYAVLAVPAPLVLHRLTGAGLLWQRADSTPRPGCSTRSREARRHAAPEHGQPRRAAPLPSSTWTTSSASTTTTGT